MPLPTETVEQMVEAYKREVIDPYPGDFGRAMIDAAFRHAAHVKFMEERGLKSSELPAELRKAFGGME